MIINRRIDELCQDIRKYLDIFEQECPFTIEQRDHHIRTIKLRYSLGNISTALNDDSFLQSLWEPMRSWSERAARNQLNPFEEFKDVLLNNRNETMRYENKKIDDKNLQQSATKVAYELWDLIDSVRVSTAKSPVVSGSKTLHHLLPELIPPIDRTYTGYFFYFEHQDFQNKPKKVFIDIWRGFVQIASKVDLRPYVRQNGWNTSITKVADNAIIGYIKEQKKREFKVDSFSVDLG